MNKPATVRLYAPDIWGALEKFSKFYAGTYNLTSKGKKAVSGAISHFHKAIVLKNLAIKLTPNLDVDYQNIQQYGYSDAINSKELSAVIEATILELYSSLDCSRQVITEIYSKYQGIPDSTRKFFQNIQSDSKNIDENFPEELRLAVKEATWYNGFRMIRDELTHHDTGSCHKDQKTGKIWYSHSSIKFNDKSMIINDIFDKIEQSFNEVNQFIGRVFFYLCSQLNDTPITQICGIFNGRAYTRLVSPKDAVDFHGGKCESKVWFDLENNPRCIFFDKCGAYKN